MHLIWLSVVLPPMAFIVLNFRQTRRLEIWARCFWIALVVTAIWTGVGWFSMETQASIFTPQAMLYALVTSHQLPILAMTTGSAMNWLIVRTAGQTPLKKPEPEITPGDPGDVATG
jgi:hypothetical protein